MKCRTEFLALLLTWTVLDRGFAGDETDARFPKHRFVTANPDAQDMWPCFSPDSRTLLFSRTTDRKSWNLLTISVDGGRPTPFPEESPAHGTRANWSARHNLIAFNGQMFRGRFSLNLVNGDGSGLRALAAAEISDQMTYPSWYPDGKSFAVVDFSGEGSAIKRIDIENGTVVRLTDPETHWAGVPRVSPDGKLIVMGGQVKRGQSYSQFQNQIWFLNHEGELRLLDSKRGRAPFWSPDGKWIVFASDRGSDSGQRAIFVASPDGATVRQLTPNKLNAGHPTWSPDGKLIAFYAQRSVDRMDSGLAVLNVTVDHRPDPRTAASASTPGGDARRSSRDNDEDFIRPFRTNPGKSGPPLLVGSSRDNKPF